MTERLLEQFNKLSVWKRRDQRAPHKPLLALWAIGQCLRGRARLIEYAEIHEKLLPLLQTFGPPRKHYKPQEPFWRLQKQLVWEVTAATRIPVQSNGSVAPSKLRELNAQGGFPSSLYEFFRQNPAAALRVAQQIAEAHFPATMHSAVLDATVGYHNLYDTDHADRKVKRKASLLLTSAFNRRNRNPRFRRRVLRTYDYKCAVCQYSFEFPSGHWPALEAAHIKWHSHRGPDEACNGLSLCVLHHELFDWGVFTIQPNTLKVLVTKSLLAGAPDDRITSFHDLPLPIQPNRSSDQPAEDHLNWHIRNVFRDT